MQGKEIILMEAKVVHMDPINSPRAPEAMISPLLASINMSYLKKAYLPWQKIQHSQRRTKILSLKDKNDKKRKLVEVSLLFVFLLSVPELLQQT